jgi:L-fuconolactonase
MMIVDTHVHVLSDDRERYRRREGAPGWPALSGEDLIATMDACGIDRAVLVQAYLTYGNDNSYAVDAARAHPERFLSVCVLDQLAGDAPDVLSDLVENHGVRGLRLMARKRPGILNNPQTFPLWERAATLEIPVCVAAELTDIDDALAVIARFPQVPVALEHMWGLELGDPPYERIAPVLAAAQLPNVKLKLTPDNWYAARAGAATPRTFFRLLAGHIEPQRMMWGSNYPARWDTYGTIPERLALMRDDLAVLGDDWNRWFFGDSALTLWPTPGPSDGR